MSVESIRVFKEVLGVNTDQELATALGVDRSTVAQWKRRGVIPERYYGLLNLENDRSAQLRFYNAVRAKLFSRPEHAYFLRAALHFLPPSWPSSEGEEAGAKRERIVITLMNLAQLTSLGALEKPHPESAEDYRLLLAAMELRERAVIALIVADEVPQSVPQSPAADAESPEPARDRD